MTARNSNVTASPSLTLSARVDRTATEEQSVRPTRTRRAPYSREKAVAPGTVIANLDRGLG